MKKKPKLLPFVVEIRVLEVTSHCVWATSASAVLDKTPQEIIDTTTGHLQRREPVIANIKPWPKGSSSTKRK